MLPKEPLRPQVRIIDDPNPKYGYLLGNFILSYRQDADLAAVEFDCESEDTSLNIELETDRYYEGLKLYAVAPGKCALKSYKKLYFDRQLRWSVPFEDEDPLGEILIAPGEIVYLGDFDARTSNWQVGPLLALAIAGTTDAPKMGVEIRNRELEDVESEFWNTFPLFEGEPIRRASEDDGPRHLFGPQ